MDYSVAFALGFAVEGGGFVEGVKWGQLYF